MKFAPEEVLQYVREEEVKFIRLAFCDVFGRQKNIAIMSGELERAFAAGIAIDASAIGGLGERCVLICCSTRTPPRWSSFPGVPSRARRPGCSVTSPIRTAAPLKGIPAIF